MRIFLTIALVCSGVCNSSGAAVTSENLQEIGYDDYEYTVKDFEELVVGVLEGALETSEPPTMKECIKNGEAMFLEIAQAVEDLKDGTKEGSEAGIKLIGEVVQEASGELVECQVAVDDFEKLAKMSDSFSNPMSFLFHAGFNIFVNHVKISEEITDAINAWDDHDFHHFGYNIGEALAHIVVGSKDEETAQLSIE